MFNLGYFFFLFFIFLSSGQLTKEGLLYFLMCEENNLTPMHRLDLGANMKLPLAAYYINSSHNTYLTGKFIVFWFLGVFFLDNHYISIFLFSDLKYKFFYSHSTKGHFWLPLKLISIFVLLTEFMNY